MFPSFTEKGVGYWPFYLVIGVLAGLAIGYSAWMQGKAAAGACSAFVDTEKGFANYLIALGVIETVAIFVLVFLIVIMGKLPDAKTLSKSTSGIVNQPAKVQLQSPGAAK
jgi:F0F1-type ATP synthase membrane subunit c/vacuolar-type H+-ATPase subunit K